mmetsp:Transcript_53964/g.69291  ORF Transcript_53964/g.69291 Transcript_53964/m.69291 type:complete len:279 (+) Transcript_53964:125-961(+)
MDSSDSKSNKTNRFLLINSLSGASAGFVTDSLFYGLDSFKTQSQAKSGTIVFSRLFKGLVPLALLGSVPSFGIFFSIYESSKTYLENSGYTNLAVPLSSLAGGIPASIVAVPADLIKKRVVVGVAESPIQAFQQVIKLQGFQGLFTGWQLNLLKDVPFAVFKLSIYEASMKFYLLNINKKRDLTPNEKAGCGIMSGAITAFVTNPLDVINTRMKISKTMEANSMQSFFKNSILMIKEEGLFILMKGFSSRLTIISFGSGVFWGTYSHSKNILNKYLVD